MFTGIRLFNRLPRTIQSLSKNRISFKNNLFSYLMNNSFYTVARVCMRARVRACVCVTEQTN
jgi:hypothetical protein